MIGDLAYDSDPLDQRLRQRGIRLIAPHKATASGQTPRTDASCDAIAVAGRSNACLPGCLTFAVWSFVGSITRPTSLVGSSSVASSS